MAQWGMLAVGQVVKRGIARPDSVKVRCLKMKLDKHLNKYFNTRKHYWAIEGDIKTDIGDIILIQRLPEKLTVDISHEIKEQVFKLGAVVDPVSGKQCRGKILVDDELRQLEEEQIAEEKSKKSSTQSN